MGDMDHLSAIKHIRQSTSSSCLLADIPIGAFHPSAQILTNQLHSWKVPSPLSWNSSSSLSWLLLPQVPQCSTLCWFSISFGGEHT